MVWSILLYPLQADRVCFAGIPLGHIDISIVVHTDIVGVLKECAVLGQGLQGTVAVFGGIATGHRHHPVVFIEDGHEAGAGIPGHFADQRSEIYVFPMDDGAADVRPGQVYVADVFTRQAEALELVALPLGDEEGGVGSVARVQAYTVGVVEVGVSGPAAAEDVFQASLWVVVQDVLRPIAIGDIDIAVGRDSGFGGDVFIGGGVLPAFLRPGDFQDDLSIEGCFEDGMAVVVGDPEELLAVFIAQSEAVGTGVFVAPGTEALSGAVVYNDVVFGFVREQEQAALFIHDHFVTVVDRHFSGVEGSPGGIGLIAEPAMSDTVRHTDRCRGAVPHSEGCCPQARAHKSPSIHSFRCFLCRRQKVIPLVARFSLSQFHLQKARI